MSKDFRSQLLRATQALFGGLAVVFLIATIWSGYRALQVSQFGVTANVAPFASATATLFLVVVTAYYARSTRQNVDLASQELNRKIREKHTETLRKRVEAWIGEGVGVEQDSTRFGERKGNFPYVTGVGIESAPPLMSVKGREEDFRAVPEAIENDLYLQDLLNNHATDLKDLKESIESLNNEFTGIRSDFENQYSDTKAIEELPFPAEPGYRFEEWAFERILLLERDISDKQELYNIAQSVVEDETHRNEENILYPGDKRNLGAVIQSPIDAEPDEEDVVEAMRKTIDRLDENEETYSIAEDAAMILEEAEEECNELLRKLIEYRGRLVYPGDCEYIEEAST